MPIPVCITAAGAQVLRNLSQQENIGIKRRFGPYVEQMVKLLKAPDITAELFVEVRGGMATNVTAGLLREARTVWHQASQQSSLWRLQRIGVSGAV